VNKSKYEYVDAWRSMSSKHFNVERWKRRSKSADGYIQAHVTVAFEVAAVLGVVGVGGLFVSSFLKAQFKSEGEYTELRRLL
jgi:hypothetical protein